MKILYFGTACDEVFHNYRLKVFPNPYIEAQYLLESTLIDGLASQDKPENLECNFFVQLPSWPKSDFFGVGRKVENLKNGTPVSYVPFLNLPGIKFFTLCVSAFFITLFWLLRKSEKKSGRVIILPVHYVPIVAGVFLARFFAGGKVISVVTDIERLGKKPSGLLGNIKYWIFMIYSKFSQFLQRGYDGYSLVALPMNDVVNPKKRPTTLLEGIYTPVSESVPIELPEKPFILFAGSLFQDYGIDIIIDAFESLDRDDITLCICGTGDMQSFVSEKAQQNPNIYFYGFTNRNQVIYLENHAALLVNIRDPKKLFTRYSFPSKLFEYLASGTPVLSSRLDGIPEEYYCHMFVSEEYNAVTIGKLISEIIDMDSDDLDRITEGARSFVLDKKSKEAQVGHFAMWLRENFCGDEV